MNICFLDFWDNFDPKNNFFIHYFKKLLDNKNILVTNLHDADIVLYSCFGNSHLNVNRNNKIKIFYTGENIRPNFNECDYSFTFDYDDYGGKNIRIPLWYLYIDWFNVNTYSNPNYLLPVNEINGYWFNNKKTNTCCTVFSNPKIERILMMQALKKHFDIHGYGKPFGNWTDGEKDKYEKISTYKASICFENSVKSGYVTEKLLHARTAGNLAIYYGHKDTNLDFNEKGYINTIDFKSFDECADYINYILNNENKYNEIIKEPIFNCKFFDFDDKVKTILC